MENITLEQFNAYESVRRSGATNMFDTKKVTKLSGLDRKQILTIMANYSKLKFKFSKND
jgi:hypothetical protein